MSLSFTLAQKPLPLKKQAGKPRVLVTGASGNIGAYFAEHAASKYGLRLMVRDMDEKSEKIKSFGELLEEDLQSGRVGAERRQSEKQNAAAGCETHQETPRRRPSGEETIASACGAACASSFCISSK